MVADDRIVIIATGVLDETRRAEFLDLAGQLRARCLADPGTLAWTWLTDTAEPARVWIHEEYADAAALDVHRTTALPHLPPILRCFAEPLVAHRCAPLLG